MTNIASDPFHVLHMDTDGPYTTGINRKDKILLIVVDEAIGYTSIRPIENKEEKKKKHKPIIDQCELCFKRKVQALKSDNEKEFESPDMKEPKEKYNLILEPGVPDVPETREKIKRDVQTV